MKEINDTMRIVCLKASLLETDPFVLREEHVLMVHTDLLILINETNTVVIHRADNCTFRANGE